MEARLLPLNAVLGLATHGDINPPVLANTGFRVVGLEIPAVGPAGKVVIDALLFHDSSNHLVQCESKSGANIEEDQARAYAVLPVRNVVQAAYVDLRQRTAPTLETLYLCLTEHVERIRLGLKRAKVSFSVLAVDASRIELHDPQFASDLLRHALQGGVELLAPPTRIIPFDPNSPVRAIEKYVRASLVSMLASRTPHVSLTGLTERVAPHYGLYGQRAQGKLKLTIGNAVRTIVDSAPDRFAFDPPAGARPEGLIRFLRTPEDYDRRGRTQAYQALARAGRASRGRKAPVHPNQLDLLGELDATDNSDDEPSATVDEEGGQS